MYFIFAIVFIFVLVFNWNDAGALSFMIAVPAALGACAIVLLCLMPFRDSVEERSDLAALSDGVNVQGSFFLGSGSIEGRPAFFYYSTNADGGSVLQSEYADDVTVYQTENDNPYMEKDCKTYSNLPKAFYSPIDIIFGDTECHGDVRFYIPEGSIQSNYMLDAE